MKALELTKTISEKMEQVAITIASFFDDKYSEQIYQRIINVPFYFYESDKQINRLKYVDLLEVALKQVKDTIKGFKLNDDDRLNYLLALVVKAGYLCSGDRNECVAKLIEDDVLLSKNKDFYLMIVTKTIRENEATQEVKDIKERIEKATQAVNDFDRADKSAKIKAIKRVFKLSLAESIINEVWDKMAAFGDNPYFDDKDYLYRLEENKKFVYKAFGLQGSTLSILTNNAKKRNMVIDGDKLYRVYDIYNQEFNKISREYSFKGSNLDEIISDLRKRGYHSLNQEALCRYLFNKSNFAINVGLLNKEDRIDSFILYRNEAFAYSQAFTTTFIHELIHHLGRGKKELGKKGLIYTLDGGSTIDLEEAYTVFLTNSIVDKYLSNNECVTKPLLIYNYSNKYLPVMDYMKEVFKLYGDKLQMIHLNEDISYSEACKLVPIPEIIFSIKKILTEKENAEVVIKEEVEKLKGVKKHETDNRRV